MATGFVGLPLLGGPRRPQRKPRAHTSSHGSEVTIGRRELLVALGSAAAAWPLAACAQQPERIRRIGALLYPAADDPTAEASIAAFRQGLQRLGWSEGRNISIDLRWGGGDLERVRRYAAELVASAPDVLDRGGDAVEHAIPKGEPSFMAIA